MLVQEAPRRRLLQAEPALAPLPAPACHPKMRAVFLLFFPANINATYGQFLVRYAPPVHRLKVMCTVCAVC